MKSYKPDSPAFSGTIQIVETTDPAHADNINAATKQLHDNTICLVTSLTDTDAITKAFESVFSHISGSGGETETGNGRTGHSNSYQCRMEWRK